MYSISNRRYTGSKYKLLDWIEKLILENCEGDSFFDVFAGTGVVSAHMSKHYKKVIMNDFYILMKSYIRHSLAMVNLTKQLLRNIGNSFEKLILTD